MAPISKSTETVKNVKFASPINDSNEDSLFNDDEFSDIVNNIINSSELIDFDDDECINLKNSIKLNDSKALTSEKVTKKSGCIDECKKTVESLSSFPEQHVFRCDTCSKNYANNKSLQKHFTTNLHSLNSLTKIQKESCEKDAPFIKKKAESKIVEVAADKNCIDQDDATKKLQESVAETNKTFKNTPTLSPPTISSDEVVKKPPATFKEKDPQICSPLASVEPKMEDLKTAFRSKGALKVFELPLPKISTPIDQKSGDGILNDIFDKLCNTATMNNQFDTIRSSNQLNTNHKTSVEKFAIVAPTSTTKTKDFEENLKRSKINFANLMDANRMKTSESLFDHIKEMDKVKEPVPIQVIPELSKVSNQKAIKKPVLLNKINKIKETTVSLPTKSLIMGKIFKKQNKDKSKVEISSESDCKNDLDRIFDHLKNTDEIDDRILTCSPTQPIHSSNIQIEPVKSEQFKMQVSNGVSTDDEEVGINNSDDEVSIGHQKNKKRKAVSVDNNSDLDKGFEPEGKRKSSRKCAIKAKTCAETWSSDEYEEFHNFDVIQLIDEIEKKNSDVAKRTIKKSVKEDTNKKQIDETSVDVPEISSQIPIETTNGRNHFEHTKFLEKLIKPTCNVKRDKKNKLSEVVDFVDSEDESLSSIMIKEVSSQKKQSKPGKVAENRLKKEKNLNKIDATEKIDSEEDNLIQSAENISENHKKGPTYSKKIKKSKKNLPEMVESEEDSINIALETEMIKANENKMTKINIENIEPQPVTMTENHHIENVSRREKLDKKITNNNNNHQSANCNMKKKLLKGRKKRNRPKNMAYDSDSDFELNLHKKRKLLLNQGAEAEELSDCHKSTAQLSDNETYKSDRKSIDQTSKRDLTDSLMADVGDGEAANRTKRISSEKLYYWSSSSSGSDAEQDEDGRSFIEKLDEDKNELPQHGWIVGDSHKKLVKLLAHAKIKKKIN